MFSVEEMKGLSKDDLAVYVKDAFGVELDKRKKLEHLQDTVIAMMNESSQSADDVQNDAGVAASGAEYLKHPENGRVFVATDLLRARNDMIPCDEEGNPVVKGEQTDT